MTDTTNARPTWRLEYTPPSSGTIRVSGTLDGDAVWVFGINDSSAEHGGALMISVQVPHYSFLAFQDARGFFADLAVENPDTLDKVRRILDRNGFTPVDPTWPPRQTAEAQR